MVKTLPQPSRRSQPARHGSQVETKLQENVNDMGALHPKDEVFSLFYDEESQKRHPKGEVSALDLDLAQESAGRKEEWRSTFQQRAPTAGLNSSDMVVVG